MFGYYYHPIKPLLLSVYNLVCTFCIIIRHFVGLLQRTCLDDLSLRKMFRFGLEQMKQPSRVASCGRGYYRYSYGVARRGKKWINQREAVHGNKSPTVPRIADTIRHRLTRSFFSSYWHLSKSPRNPQKHSFHLESFRLSANLSTALRPSVTKHTLVRTLNRRTLFRNELLTVTALLLVRLYGARLVTPW